MTEDARQHDDAALEHVSRAYTAAGFDETPPAHVDRALLAYAARTAARRRLRLKPLHVAWAAVVMLSIALVLDVALVPDSPTATRQSGTPTPPAENASSDAPAPAIAPEGGLPPSGVEARREARTLAVDDSRDASAPAVESDRDVQPTAGPEPEAAPGVAAFGASDQAAEQLRRARAAAEPSTGEICTDRERSTPDSWLDCIAGLSGPALDRELAAFRARHPDRLAPSVPEPARR